MNQVTFIFKTPNYIYNKFKDAQCLPFFKPRIKCKDMNTYMCICAYNLYNINYNDTTIVPVLSVYYTISTILGMLILAHFTLYWYFDI